MLRAICFDVDGTLYPQSVVRMQMAWRLAHAVARGTLKMRDVRTIQAYRRALEHGRAHGQMENLGARLLEDAATATHRSVEEVCALVRKWIYEAPLPILAKTADPRLRHVLARLRVRGYRLGVLSDYPAIAKLEALGLPKGLFDAVVEARDPSVNALKPHSAGFVELARRLQTRAGEILYVGDRESVDGLGARQAGMQFVLCGRGATGETRCVTSVLSLEAIVPATANGGTEAPQKGCWLCGSDHSNLYLRSTLKDTAGSESVATTGSEYGQTAELVRCEECGFIRAIESQAARLQKLYRGMRDDQYEASASARKISFERLFAKMRELLPRGKSMLDIGAGTGIFCEVARTAGLDVEGIEPSRWAVEEAQRRRGIRLIESYFPCTELNGKKFDYVVAIDVIEHVSDPVAFLRACRDALADGGMLVLVTPNIQSMSARVMGRHWWHLRPAHIGYFNPLTMIAALGAAGLGFRSRERFKRWFEIRYIADRLRPVAAGWMLNSFFKILPSKAGSVRVPVSIGDSETYFAFAVPGNGVGPE